MEGWKSSRMRPSLCSHSLSHLATPSSYSVVFFVTSECLEYVNIQIYIYNTYCCMHWHTFFCKTGAWSWGLELCEIKSCWCVSKIEVPKIHWLPFRWIMNHVLSRLPWVEFCVPFHFGDMHVVSFMVFTCFPILISFCVGHLRSSSCPAASEWCFERPFVMRKQLRQPAEQAKFSGILYSMDIVYIYIYHIYSIYYICICLQFLTCKTSLNGPSKNAQS